MKKSTKRKAAKKHTGTKVTALSLTILQKRFAHILHSMPKPNQAEAYRLAGYKGKPSVREVNACRLLKNDKVAAYMKTLTQKAMERAERTADEIIAELEKVGFSSIGDYLAFGPNGVVLKDSTELTKEQLAAIESISETTTQHGGTIRFKLHDKPESLHLLGKRHGLFPNRQEITGEDGGPLELNVTVTKTYKKKK